MDNIIKQFQKGTSYLDVVKTISKSDLKTPKRTIKLENQKVVKFIPASGAATRMFQPLYEYLETNVKTPFVTDFLEHITLFPFYNELELYKLNDEQEIIKRVLDTYGDLPKALIPIHKYQDQVVTPIEEHIYETLQYVPKEHLEMHFTISKEHEQLFLNHLKMIEQQDVNITYSFQDPKTDTLAVTKDNQPFLDEDNNYLYRAGGHGALIHNLNKIDADIIYIKNIDNVCHRSKLSSTVESRNSLTSIGLEIQEKIHGYTELLEYDRIGIDEVRVFLETELHITIHAFLSKERALRYLKRPLRVCGVVKNEGEPGGGPFIIKYNDFESPQIVEMKELDTVKLNTVLKEAEYFNPVDLVCFVKDYHHKKYDLLQFVNSDRYFISEKSYKGRTLKALEHPGLWNGAMDLWNTVFVEIDIKTFNPVKTVNDLLRSGHLE
jgi:hypothetical protein